MTKQAGFTLLELIITIVIIGIIAMTASSRIANKDTFAIRIEQENLISTLNLAQQLAMAGQTVQFNINGAGKNYTLTTGGADYQVASISYPLDFQDSVSSITSTASLPLSYDSLGRTGATTLTVNGAAGDSLCVEVNNSGLARAVTCP